MNLWNPPRSLALALAALAVACGGDDSSGEFGDGSASAGVSGGTDGTSGGSSASAGESDGPPPELEDEGDFRVPKASGKYVYSASETTDSVAVIDSATLAIDVIGVGQGPTVVEPLPGQVGAAGSVVVLDQGSDDIAILRTDALGLTTLEIHPVTPGANNLAVAPDGRFVFVYHDVDGPEALGPGSDQELTVLDVGAGVTHAMTVGAHPRDVVFATDDSRAWVITDAGVNVIAFADLGMVGKPPLLPVTEDSGIDPATLEVVVVASQGIALARVDGEASLTVTDLAGGARTILDLPGVPTDLDVAPGGDFAILTLPSLVGSSSFLEVALPLVPGDPAVQHVIDGEYVGQSTIAASGDAILFFTTVDPFFGGATAPATPTSIVGDAWYASTTDATSGSTTDVTSSGTSDGTTEGEGEDPPRGDPRQRITLARRSGPGWELVTLFVEIPVTSVGVAPDSRSAILVHAADPGNLSAPWSYSLFDQTAKFPLLKRQTTEAAPGPVLFTPDGRRAAVLLRDDPKGVRKVDRVDLDNFIVSALPLGSPPEGAGYVADTQKIFISQEHPSGRITFVGPTGEVQTVTGYVLNDTVKD